MNGKTMLIAQAERSFAIWKKLAVNKKMLKIKAPFSPTGDQPKTIKKINKWYFKWNKHQCLLGVTGSGKTTTIANVIEQTQKQPLILCHNKTLAAQLYSKFKIFK